MGDDANAENQITVLLTRLRGGDSAAAEQLIPLVYADLHARAAAIMRGERQQGTLQPTALVHEAWMRLQKSPGNSCENRRHFLRLAGRVMRNVLVDRARRRREHANVDVASLAITLPPGSGSLPLSHADGSGGDCIDVLDLQTALERLAERDPELEEIVDMRFFAGLTLRETAEALGKSVTGVHRAWELARTFLLRELRQAKE